MRKRLLIPVLTGLLCLPLAGLYSVEAHSAVSPLATDQASSSNKASAAEVMLPCWVMARMRSISEEFMCMPRVRYLSNINSFSL